MSTPAAACHFELDGRVLTAEPGETVWQAASRAGIILPHLCLSTAPDFRPDGNCRVCVVEIEDHARLQPSCVVRVEPGMRVRAESERARAVRRVVMELMVAEASIAPAFEAARLAASLGVGESRFALGPVECPSDDSHPGIRVDHAACVRCLRCVQACREVETNDVIGLVGRGVHTRIGFDFDDPMGRSSCVSCGSCAQACPTGAIAVRSASP